MVTADRIAHEQTVRATVPEMAAHLKELFGQRVTAVILGISDPKAVGRYASGGQKPQLDVERCLRATFHVVKLLEQVESAEAIRAWFMGMNPQLDDRAPALLIRTEPEEVLQAARTFLWEG